MNFRLIIRRGIEIALALALPVAMTVVAAQSQQYEDLPSAEGRLSTAYQPASAADYPLYPGEDLPLYPGDEKWNGYYVMPVYPYNSDSYVDELATDGKDVYAGMHNRFNEYFIGRWNGSQHWEYWQQLHFVWDTTSYSRSVKAIAFQGKNLFLGGRFNLVDGKPVNNIAWWNGSQWNDMAGGITLANPLWYRLVNDIAVGADGIYAAGFFDHAGGVAASNIARWDGTRWHALGSGLNGSVSALAVIGKDVYAGGPFTLAGTMPVNGIARWDGSKWNAVGGGVSMPVRGSSNCALSVNALAVYDRNLYAGGCFDQAGTVQTSNIARWDGMFWHALGDGVGGYSGMVNAIQVSENGVYAAGAFREEADAYAMNSIAFYNGSTWTNLGSGLRYEVITGYSYPASLLLDGERLFVGGIFSLAGNNWSSGFATWNTQPSVEPYSYWDAQNMTSGSVIYLIGRYFEANEPVEVEVNGTPLPPLLEAGPSLAATLTADADGKIYINLQTSQLAQPGWYTLTLTGAAHQATWTFRIHPDGSVSTPYFAGDLVNLPENILPMRKNFLPLSSR